MNSRPDRSKAFRPVTAESPWNARIAVITVLTAGIALCLVLWTSLTNTTQSSGAVKVPLGAITFPTGVVNVLEPSGQAPPTVSATLGYTLSYVNDFNGAKLPTGWYSYSGLAGGDPGSRLASTHVVVKRGLLQLNTWRDPRFKNKWVSGGLCQCGRPVKFGAFFVRSRVTRAGPNEAELLWPASNVWPPEIDFTETGAGTFGTSATLHFGTANHIDQVSLRIDMTQWHTWGVIWTPNSISYSVDGRVWGIVTLNNEIPRMPMTLDLEQVTKCNSGQYCPSAPASLLVDWIAEYSPK